MKITTKLLRKHGACEDGLKWFADNYPDGCELTDETIAKAKNVPTDFVWWFYNNMQQDNRLYALCGVNVSMRWSNGRTLGVVPGEDDFTVISKPSQLET